MSFFLWQQLPWLPREQAHLYGGDSSQRQANTLPVVTVLYLPANKMNDRKQIVHFQCIPIHVCFRLNIYYA